MSFSLYGLVQARLPASAYNFLSSGVKELTGVFLITDSAEPNILAASTFDSASALARAAKTDLPNSTCWSTATLSTI